MPILWRRLRALPPAERRLLVETALLIVGVRAALRLFRLDALLKDLERPPAPRRVAPHTPDRLGWAVSAVARRLPGTTCLAESLAAHTLLRRRGYAPALHIGVRGAGAMPLDAHAWVECEGRVVAGDVGDLAAYDELKPVRPPAPTADR